MLRMYVNGKELIALVTFNISGTCEAIILPQERDRPPSPPRVVSGLWFVLDYNSHEHPLCL